LRVRTLGTVLCSSLTVAACAATPALAGTTSSAAVAGGAAAGSTPAPTPTPTSTSVSGGASPTTPAKPAKPLHLSPITAKTPSVAYSGPVYEKTATGAVVPYVTPAPPVAPGQTSPTNGGSPVGATATVATKPDLLVPGTLARYVNGLAAAPMSAPPAVQAIVWAGNQLIGLPYIFGGGHASFTSPGYDCSGTVSFALHGGDLLATPEDSSEFETWGSHGVGRWVTIFANPGHAYMTVAGLRLDTSAADDPSNEQGPRWRPLRPENSGYVVRHPLGL
jgi:cell wall-associated NlpC family hydrolase